MNRKIGWESYEFDEIELVYEKAEENESIGRLLEQLEIQALAEAKANCGLLMTDAGGRISPEQFDNLEEEDKETVIKVLSGLGLGSVEQDLQKGIFHVWFTNKIQTVMACTMFALLNYLEKLDVTEEKVRLKNHCRYFREVARGEEEPGRKLGFIAQEIGREINTLGSKANQADIQRIVVQMKDELEKIKEQLLNLL